MCDLQQWISQYLLDCQYQKGLDPKTIKAYRIDLAQFLELAGHTKRDYGIYLQVTPAI